MKSKICKKILSFALALILTFNSIAPSFSVAYANEETTPTPNITEPMQAPAVEQVTPTPTQIITPNETTITPTETPTMTETPTPTETQVNNLSPTPTENIINTPTPQLQSQTATEKICLDNQQTTESTNEDWNIDNDKNIAQTKEKVKLGLKYVFPLENKVTVTFKCLPKDESLRTTLKIQKIKSSDLKLPSDIGEVDEYAYDITTDMQDGNFEYDITLPKKTDQAAEINYIEKTADEIKSQNEAVKTDEIKTIEEIKTSQENETVKATSIDHFTIYIATYSNATFTTEKSVYSQGETVYAKAGELDATKYYKIRINFPGSSNYSDSTCYSGTSGTITYEYALPSNATISTGWKAELIESSNNICNSGSIKKTETFEVVKATVASTSNPPLTQACGLDIALVIDVSGSIDDTELNQMKSAFTSFVDALAGTPTYYTVTQFATTATPILPNFTSDIATVKNKINSANDSSCTNWEEALNDANGTFGGRADKPDLVLFTSDGNPNTIIGGTGCGAGETIAVDAAVSKANIIKSAGRRVLALGIGNSLDVENLKAISGSNVNTGNVLTSDVITTTDYAGLATQLATFAKQTCGGKISINKYVDNVQQSDGQTWSFKIDGTTTLTTDTQGQTVSGTLSVGSHSVSEISIPAGYTFDHATCTNGTSDTPNNGVKNINVTADSIITCNFYNTKNKTDLKMTKTDSVDPVNNGGPLSYTLTVQNLTTVPAADTIVTDTLPTGFTPTTITPSQGSCSDITAPSIQCELGTINASATATITITGTVNTNTAQISNTASVTTTTTEVSTTNNTDTETTNVNLTGTIELKKAWSGTGGQTTLKIGTTVGGAEIANVQTGASGATPLTTGVKTVTGGVTYYVSESTLNDYISTLACTDNGSPVSLGANNSVIVNPTHAIVCTYTNTRKTGSVKVNSLLDNDGNGTFETVNPVSFNWNLDGSGTNTMGSTKTSVNTGVHSVNQNSVSGYHYIGWYIGPTDSTTYSCSNPSILTTTALPAGITVNNSATTEITICNARDVGTIIVHKDVQGPTGQAVTDTSNTFKVKIDGVNEQNIKDGETVTYSNIPTGSHTITESLVAAGYTLYGIGATAGVSGSTTGYPISVSKDITSHVYVTNRQQNATITISKNVINPDGTEVADTHLFAVKKDGLDQKTINEGQNATYVVAPGTYTFTENLDSDYTLDSIIGDNDSNSSNGATITVIPGETASLTFVNKQIKARIVVSKVVKDALGQIASDSQEFTVRLNGTNDRNTLSDTHNETYYVNPGGPFSITEVSDANYNNLGCKLANNGDANGIYLTSNQTTTVTCTNQQKPGTISGYKYMANGTTGILGWTINLYNCSLGGVCTFKTSTTTNTSGYYTFAGLTVGSYRVEEVANQLYTAIGNTTHDVTIVPNTNSTNNNFTNFKNINITVCKKADTDGILTTTGDQSIVSEWGMTLYTDNTAGGLQRTGTNGCYTFSNLGPNKTYKVVEENRTGWTPLSDTDYTYDFAIPADGVDQNHTFVNVQRGTITVKTVMLDGTGSFDYAGSIVGTISTNNGTLTTADPVLPGTYTSVQNLPTGWQLKEIKCDDENSTGNLGSRTATFNVTAGENVTCTFTNAKLSINAIKTVNPTSIPETGADVEFTVKVENPSAVAVNLTSLVDDKFGSLNGEGTCAVPQTIASSGYYQCKFTKHLDGNAGLTHENVITAIASGIADDDNAIVTYTDVKPDIKVEKTANPTSVPETGGNVEFTYVVTNKGAEDAEITSLTDDKFGTLAGDSDCMIGTILAGGASCSFKATFAVPAGTASGTHENIFTAIVKDNDGNTDSDTDNEVVAYTDVKPSVVVTKTANPTSIPETGGNVEYEFTVTNNGSVSATVTSLTDDKFGTLTGDNDCKVGTLLLPNASCSFKATFAVPAGDHSGADHVNIFTAHVQDNEKNDTYDEDDATVDYADVDPTITITKTANPTEMDVPGGNVTFSVAITNNSFETVTLTSLNDDIYGNLNGVGTCYTGGSIMSGNTYKCSFVKNVSGTPGEYKDVITVVATDNDGSTDTKTDDATVTLKGGKIIIEKQTLPDGSTQSFKFKPSWSIGYFYLKDGQTRSDGLNGYMAPGTYSIKEVEIPSEWDLTSATCSDGSSIDSISLQDREIITCTFTNTQRGTIVVNKNVVSPDGITDVTDNHEFTTQLNGKSDKTISETTTATYVVEPGIYTVSELEDQDYSRVSCRLASGADATDFTLNPGENIEITCTNKQKTGTITGYKWNDINSNRERDCESNDNPELRQQCSYTESTLSGWTINLHEDNDGLPGAILSSATTDENGNYTLNAAPGEYWICEAQQAGWEQTYPNFDSRYPGCWKITLGSNEDKTDKNFGNHNLIPKLTIAKSNDATDTKGPGGVVGYTIMISNDKNAGPASNVTITDLLPKGFAFDTSSWKVVSNDSSRGSNGDITSLLTAPAYHSPGIWTLGTIKTGETLTLTYKSNIASEEQNGTYKDIAWGQGYATGDPDNEIIATALTTGYVDQNFVGTEVTISNNNQGGPEYNVTTTTTKEVLGASTGPELPSTGENTIWSIIAILSLIMGTTILTAGLGLRRKNE